MIIEASRNSRSTGFTFKLPPQLRADCPLENLLSSLQVSVEVDGQRLCPAQWNASSDGKTMAVIDGIQLEVACVLAPGGKAESVLVASLTNNTGADIRFNGFGFTAIPNEPQNDFLSIPGSRIRLYKEGWSMTSVAGTVRYGDKDFFLNPDYKPFSVSSPADYDNVTPNHFSAESVVILNDKDTGLCLLLGFVSSADQVTRISVNLAESGITRLDAFSHGDNIVVPAGSTIRSEELIVMAGRDGYGMLEEFGALWGKRMKAITWSHTPVGWCSWPYYSWRVSEKNMIENARWLHENRSEFPLEYMQMDDGYQSALGDWTVCDAEKFPSGLEFLAREIKACGIRPGLWLAPFLAEECSQLYKTHPEWMIRNQNGETVWALDWRGTSRTAVLDCTIPEVCDWLTSTFATLCQCGFEYFKLDFLIHECGVLALGGVYSDPRVTRVQAIRRGLLAIRKGAGDQFLLGCTNVLGAGIGIVNGCRIATDISIDWVNESERHYKEAPAVSNVCRNVINRRYMHRHLWLNDPDTHIARVDNTTLTENEIRLWTSALWLSGGMLLLGDRFNTLTPARANLSKMLINKLESFDETRPLDFFDREVPSLWLGTRRNAPGEMTLGVFNFSEEPTTYAIDPAALGIKPGSNLDVSEFWEERNLGNVSGTFEAVIPPHSCKVFQLNTTSE